MKKQLLFLISLLLMVSFSYSQTTFADYETINTSFTGWDGVSFNKVANPDKTGHNTSDNCAQTNTNDQGWGWAGMYTEPLGGMIDFTSGSVLTMKVNAPFACNVLFKLEGPNGANTEVTTAVDAANVGIWATMSFDMANANNGFAQDTYDKIVLIFDAAGNTTSDQWFFDDITGPGFTAGTGEQVTFIVSDYAGITAGLVRVYDNNDTSTDYTLYDDGTNGDATANDMAFTAVAADLTGKTFESAAGVGEYTWELVVDGNVSSDKKNITLAAGADATQSYSYYEGVVNNDTIFCLHAATAPIIDGTIDAMWENYASVPVTKTVWGGFGNPADLSVSVKTAYDATHIYFLAEISDETLSVNNGNPWEKDNIELYFDMDNSDSYEGKDGQKRWIWSDANTDAPGSSAQSTLSNGWIVEIAIPLEDLSAGFSTLDSTVIGFDITNGDNDSDHREGILSWHADNDQAYANASLLGSLMFIPEPVYNVTFTVVDENQAPVADADVVFVNKTLTTDINGVVEFNTVTPTTTAYAYAITKTGYIDATGEVTVVDADVAVNVTMKEVPPPTYSVTFTVVDGDAAAIAGADVVFANKTLTTDVNGVAEFNTVTPTTSAYAYTITKTGYVDATGEVTVVDADVNVPVTMLAVGIVNQMATIANIFPNPTMGELNIHLLNNTDDATFELYDICGSLIEQRKLNQTETILDLSKNVKGIYLVKISLNEQHFVRRVILN